jgi:hypothetical protein
MARFAAQTRVGADQTRTEIERTLSRYGAVAFGYMAVEGQAIIAFKCAERHIKITVPLPTGDDERGKQEARQRWRALLLVIKAKLESVESGIETLEEAFYANIVMPDGKTVYEATHKHVAVAYETGRVTKLLPDYSYAKPS